MRDVIRQRLTYGNVMATVAVFLAFGGGAYALSGVPDSRGVFHGCADSRTGALRVVRGTTSCRRARTVRRGGRLVRIPGESAITWNQRGVSGTAGLQGLQGLPGQPGQPGQNGSSAASAMFGRFHVTGSTTDCGLVSGTTTSDDTCTPSSGQFTPAAAMTGRDMSVHTDGGAGAVVTLQLNDTDTALTCTTDANGRCQDTTHTVAIPADSHLRFSASNPSGLGLNVQVAWRGTG